MTVEEIDILVQANVDKALLEFNKLVPAIQKTVGQVAEKINNTNFDGLSGKINNAVNFIKTKIQNLIKSSKNNQIAIKVNNADASKQITQIEKQIDSLQKKISGRQLKLDVLTNQIEQRKSSIIKDSLPQGIEVKGNPMDNPFLANQINGDKELAKMIVEANTLKNAINRDKSAVKEFKNELNQMQTPQSKIGSFFSSLKSKIGGGVSSASKLKNSFNPLPSITQKITNNIKGMGSGLKQGIGSVLKYAGALFGIRTIYNVLKGTASAWLSSQNAGAQQLSANIEYMKYAMGSTLAPIIQGITNLVLQLMKAIQSVAYALTGVNIFAKASASSMKNAAGSAKKAKEETKQLAGIHNEINNISNNDNSDSGGGGGATPDIDLTKVDSKMNNLFKRLIDDSYSVGYELGQKLNEGLAKIPWNKIQATTKNIAIKTAQFLNGFIAGTNWNLVGKTIGQGINTGLIFAYNFLREFDFKQYGNAISEMLMSAIETIDWRMLARTLSEYLKGAFDFATGFIEKIDWNVIVDAIIRFIEGIDYSGISNSFFTMLGTACASLVNLGMVIGEYINLAVDSAKEYFQEKIEECGGNIVLGILKGIGDAVIGIAEWIGEHVFKPFIDGFKSAFGIHSPSTVMAEMGGYIVEGLFNGITALIGNVVEIWDKFKTKVVEIMTSIKNKVSDKVTELKDKATQRFTELKNKAEEKVTSLKTKAVTIFDNLKNSISSKISNIKTTIVNGFNSAVEHIKSLPSQALNWGKDIIGNIISGIGSKLGELGNSIRNVASTIASYIHFSEPDVGPLSNFHTYMPDMMDLMKKGIRNNMSGLISTVEELSGRMSFALTQGDFQYTAIGNVPNTLSTMSERNILDEMYYLARSNQTQNSGGIETLVIKLDGKTIFEGSIDYIKGKSRRIGKNVIEVK